MVGFDGSTAQRDIHSGNERRALRAVPDSRTSDKGWLVPPTQSIPALAGDVPPLNSRPSTRNGWAKGDRRPMPFNHARRTTAPRQSIAADLASVITPHSASTSEPAGRLLHFLSLPPAFVHRSLPLTRSESHHKRNTVARAATLLAQPIAQTLC